MKKYFLLLFLLNSITGFNLKAQNIDKLKENNGFRDIKLGSDVRAYPNFIKKTAENSNLFSVWTNYEYILNPKENKGFEKLGNFNIYAIYLNAFNNKIYSIMVKTEKNSEIIDMLKMTFGKPNLDELNADALWWQISNIRCDVMGRTSNYKNYMYITYTDSKIEKEHESQNRKETISQF